jgi:hypothetical protein
MDSKKRCWRCGKPYEFALRAGKDWCVHDDLPTRDKSQFTQGEQRHVVDKLGRNELAVKGHDGYIRILQRKGTQSNRPAIRER